MNRRTQDIPDEGDLKKLLLAHASPSVKRANERFFKRGAGEYGYGDVFVGITMADIRLIARRGMTLPLTVVKRFMSSPVHEFRMCGFLIVAFRFAHADGDDRKRLCEYMLRNRKYLNSWDLIDVAVPLVIGAHVAEHPGERERILTLTDSSKLWEKRIAVLATLPSIRQKKYSFAFTVVRRLLGDTEDLIRKPLGWMLREIHKRDSAVAERFLRKHCRRLSRTTLRYAVRHMESAQRMRILRG